MKVPYEAYYFNKPKRDLEASEYNALRGISTAEFDLDLAAGLERERLAFVQDRKTEYTMFRLGWPTLIVGFLSALFIPRLGLDSISIKHFLEFIMFISMIVGIVCVIGGASFTMSYITFRGYLAQKKKYYLKMKREADAAQTYADFSQMEG
jgi:hypothetical protein